MLPGSQNAPDLVPVPPSGQDAFCKTAWGPCNQSFDRWQGKLVQVGFCHLQHTKLDGDGLVSWCLTWTGMHVSFPSLAESFLHLRQCTMYSIVSKHSQVKNYWNSVTKPNKVGTITIILTWQRKPREVKSNIKITELATGRAEWKGSSVWRLRPQSDPLSHSLFKYALQESTG